MQRKLCQLTKIGLREAGYDEYWLQKQIFEHPELLGLGENLIPIQREKKQSMGGKLDILLQDPDDNNALYEIEVMLGETDPSHIIRTLEYWDLERKRYPQRQHYAVLIAESVTRRFYNVIQLLSFNFPLIAMQVQLIEIEDKQALDFVKVMDVYQEQGLEVSEEIVDDKYWKKNADWLLKFSNTLLSEFKIISPDVKLNYTKSYISLMNSSSNLVYLNKRAKPNVRMEFPVRDQSKKEKMEQVFNDNNIPTEYHKKYNFFWFNIDEDFLTKNLTTFITAYKILIEPNNDNELVTENI